MKGERSIGARCGVNVPTAAESEEGVSVSIVGFEGAQAYRACARAASDARQEIILIVTSAALTQPLTFRFAPGKLTALHE